MSTLMSTASPYEDVTPVKLFSAAVRSVFENWQAFKIGTSMGKQSRDLVEMVIGATEQCFQENKDLDNGAELGEWIGEMLDINFNLRIEDGSLDDAGNKLVAYWKLYQEQNFAKLRETLESVVSAPSTMNLVPRVEGNDSSSSDDEEDEGMDMDTSEHHMNSQTQGTSIQSASNVDADGWTTVTTRKKK